MRSAATLASATAQKREATESGEHEHQCELMPPPQWPRRLLTGMEERLIATESSWHTVQMRVRSRQGYRLEALYHRLARQSGEDKSDVGERIQPST